VNNEKTPFLWEFLKTVEIPSSSSGGEEKIITESVNEENAIGVVKIELN